MGPDQDKLDSELLRWVRDNSLGKRTVIVRVAYSKNSDSAREALTNEGMEIQSYGAGVITASSNWRALERVSQLPWVIKIESPRQLHMKSNLHRS